MILPKLLFIYQYLGLGGVEAILATRMRSLRDMRIPVHAMFLQDAGGKVFFEDMPELISITENQSAIFEALSRSQPEMIVNIDTPNLISVAEQVFPGIPQVYEVHTTYAESLSPLSDYEFIAKLTSLLVPSFFQKNFILSQAVGTPLPVYIVPDPLDKRFLNPEQETDIFDHPTVAWIGRLDSHKNWQAFLRLAGLLSKQLSNLRFLLIGGLYSGTWTQIQLWQTIVELGLIDRLRWFPAVPPFRIPAILDSVAASGGCLISTSKMESFGMTVLEGMARGCPVVAPNVGALTELIGENERGLLYPNNQIHVAADQVIQITTDQKLRTQIIRPAQTFAREFTVEHSNQAFINAILKIQQSILDK